MATKPESQATPLPDTPASRDSGTSSANRQRNVRQRKSQFLVAPRRHPGMQMMGLAPLSMSTVEQALKDSPDIQIIDRVGPKQVVGALGAGMQEGGVLVALMHEDKAQALAQQAQGQLIVERVECPGDQLPPEARAAMLRDGRLDDRDQPVIQLSPPLIADMGTITTMLSQLGLAIVAVLIATGRM